jgi:hypothetical protein
MAQYPPLAEEHTVLGRLTTFTTQEDGAPFSRDTCPFLTITPVSGLANTAVTGDTHLLHFHFLFSVFVRLVNV